MCIIIHTSGLSQFLHFDDHRIVLKFEGISIDRASAIRLVDIMMDNSDKLNSEVAAVTSGMS